MPDKGKSHDKALSTRAYWYLYDAALDLPSSTKQQRLIRIETLLVILLTGRLGLRHTEVLHLRRAWIDWDRLSIYVPRRDPCACADCLEKAKQKADERNSDDNDEDGSGDDVNVDPIEILRTEQWTPKSARGQRTIFFGWSPRITAILYYYFEVLGQPGITITQQANRDRLKKASDNREVLPEMTLQPLRATAASFFASLGASKQDLLNIMGWLDEDMRLRYVRAFGLQTSFALAQLVGREELVDNIVPEDPGSRFPIALGTHTFAREPFDVEEHYLMALKKETDYQQHLTITHRPPKKSIRHLYNPVADEQTTHLHASINRLEELELRFAHDAEDGSEEKAYLREYLAESETPLDRNRLTDRLGADNENESPAEEQTAFDKDWLGIDRDVDDDRGTAKPGWPVGQAWSTGLKRAADSHQSFLENGPSSQATACLSLGMIVTVLLTATAMPITGYSPIAELPDPAPVAALGSSLAMMIGGAVDASD